MIPVNLTANMKVSTSSRTSSNVRWLLSRWCSRRRSKNAIRFRLEQDISESFSEISLSESFPVFFVDFCFCLLTHSSLRSLMTPIVKSFITLRHRLNFLPCFEWAKMKFGHNHGLDNLSRINSLTWWRQLTYSDSFSCPWTLIPIAVSHMTSKVQSVMCWTISIGHDWLSSVISFNFSTRTFACSLIIGKKSFKIRKWKAGVKIFLLIFHLFLLLVTKPSPSQGFKKSYSLALSVSTVLVSIVWEWVKS